MTITFLQPDGVPITAQAERQGSAALYGGGSGRQLGGRSGFRVGTPADTLTATSTVWTLKPCAAQIDPGATAHQGMYGWASDADITGAVTAADATYARKDIVYVQVSDSSAGDGSGAVTALVLYLAGAAAATPVAPILPARSFLLGTITVPVAGGGAPSVVLNPARFVAAGGILPATLSERDALTMHDGLTVRRTDLPGRPVEVWNGSAWRSPIEGAAVVTDANWSATGVVTRSQTPSGVNAVTIAERMARTGAGFTMDTTYRVILTGFIPAGFRPESVFSGWALLTASNYDPRAQVWWRVNTVGDLEARLDFGSVVLNTGDRFNLSGNWTAA